MASKYARNAPCPCGSGKKYKYCHGDVSNSGSASTGERSVEMQYRFDSIILSPELDAGEPRVVVNGALSFEKQEFPFLMIVEPREEGDLVIRQLGWQQVPPITDKDAVGRQLLRHLGLCLDRMSASPRPGQEPEFIAWGPPAADEQPGPHQVMLRPALARLPAPDWSTLWDRISLKLKGDPAFRVEGFSTEQVEAAFKHLEPVFSKDWVESVFRRALGRDRPAMNDSFSHDADDCWFPAYHLSRLASGVICRDPALHSLVELGLALQDLADFVDLPALRAALADRPGMHHQAALAADLFRQGLLMQVRAEGEHCDLRARVDDQPYLIRTVPVTLGNLSAEVQAWLPERMDAREPFILHAVVNESSWYLPERGLPDELDDLAVPPHVHAVVIGRRFLDAEGGPLKRHAQKIVFNDRSVHKESVRDAALERLFAPNYQHVREPALNVGTFFYLE